ncbi:MAG: arsenate reductase [Sphingomonadales bacterium]
MNELVIYGISNCDTVKKARAWLTAQGIGHRFHDFRRDGVPQDRLALWLTELGADRVINRRGTTWRKLDAAAQTRAETDALGLLSDHPSLIKRPVLEGKTWLSIGFGKAEQEGLQAWRG